MDLDEKVDRIVSAVEGLEVNEARVFIAIAGPPASGKSTLAEKLKQRLQQDGTPCGLVSMDGFHLDNETLKRRGLLSRKGAPETFDVEGFRALLARLCHEDDVPIPHFDRARDCVVQAAETIGAKQRHVIVEGNYLFLDVPDWSTLGRFWSLAIFIEPEINVLEERLIQRWLDHGFTREKAQERALGNDIVNANLIAAKSNRSAVDLEFC